MLQGYVEKLQIELQSCQENYLDAVDKCSALEEELKQCKEKLSLFQQDDLGNIMYDIVKNITLMLSSLLLHCICLYRHMSYTRSVVIYIKTETK